MMKQFFGTAAGGSMKKIVNISGAFVAVLGACATNSALDAEGGNAELGIARFEMIETSDKSTVVGYDVGGDEVGRVELIHGRFDLTGYFRDDYDTTVVDGRKLDVAVLGKSLVYETAGYDPVMHMPAHPPGSAVVGTFLEDPHVKPLLDRWQIGFDPAAGEGEVEYGYGTTGGTSAYDCLTNSPDSQCGTARTFTINTCGGGTTPNNAYRVTRTTPTYTYNEYMIDQVCPSGSGGQSNQWFAIKSCPTTGSGAQPSTCGTTGSTAACKGCAGYPANAQGAADVWTIASGLRYCHLSMSELDTCSIEHTGDICKTPNGTPIPGECGCEGVCSCSNGWVFCY